MTSEQSIIINVDSEWLHKNFIVEENQVFVFDGNKSLRLITIFDNIGMTVKKWIPSVAAEQVNKTFSWRITDNFKNMVYIYHEYIKKMNISLYYETNVLALDSHGLSTHGFR